MSVPPKDTGKTRTEGANDPSREETTFSATVRPPFTYLHLTLLSSDPTLSHTSTPIDAITARTHLTSALRRFLGITGTAISIDILKVEGRDVWIRAPQQDGSAVLEAVSGWVGSGVAWRVRASGTWLAGVLRGNGRDLFESR
jgi:ribonuclease P/MRP protein subunit POP8